MINVLVICSTFSGIVLIIYLLNIGKIGSGAFSTLFVAILLFSLALYGFDRLRELDISKFRLILDEAKEVRKDIYAKAETVKKIGEEMADLTAFSVTRVGRFASDDLQIKMLEARDKIKEVLKEIGSDQNKIDKISSQIEDMVLHDLKSDTLQAIRDEMIKLSQFNQNHTLLENTYNRFGELLKNYNRARIVDYLRETGLAVEVILPYLDKIDSFARTKNLSQG